MINYLKNEEKIILSLRALYSKYGYLPYKMNKFEEYDLYAKNKEFLIGEGVITFTDTHGKLLALKPDVTLSIIKNAAESKGVKNKVYYSENVYRISGKTREYKEIMQTGLECVGDLDLYDTYEVITLAKKSLETVSSDYVLEISHMGILSSLIDSVSTNEEFRQEVLDSIKKKSKHEIKAVSQKYGIEKKKTDLLCEFISIYGEPTSVLSRLDKMDVNEEFKLATNELKELVALLDGSVSIDFSIVNDMNYYNGIVFNGFLSGVSECVLFGGSYDKLLSKMGRRSNGIGFAIYTDLLEGINEAQSKFDVDTLLLYSENTKIEALTKEIERLNNMGKSVSAQKSIPEKLRYKEIVEI
ncbi:MAG: ATP phosphoribosyltransferase regulatory subunit [Clostridia bacterium]|nr:ATP phosphoribosyltransferase regulatory subunit [Clostridia bacterium]